MSPIGRVAPASLAARFGVVVPPGPGAVARLFQLAGVAELVRVYPTIEQGVAFLGRRGGSDGTA